MKIVNERPPIWNEVVEMIGAIPQHAVFAWGDTIYNPEGMILPDFIIAHEEVHSKQQEKYGGPEAWWSRYLDDVYFRVSQEVEAYRRQYDVMCETHRDRNVQYKILRDVARSLSGPLYGNSITHSKAMEMIRAYA